MQHLGTTPSIGNWSADTIDWLSRFQQVFANAEPGCPTSATNTDAADDEELTLTLSGCARASTDMFVDAHNTGYYINAYTTKFNVSRFAEAFANVSTQSRQMPRLRNVVGKPIGLPAISAS